MQFVTKIGIIRFLLAISAPIDFFSHGNLSHGSPALFERFLPQKSAWAYRPTENLNK